jgi:hypothetical protein
MFKNKQPSDNLFNILKNVESLVLQGSILDGYFYILIIVLFSVLYNLARFFEYETVYEVYTDNATNER